MGMQEKINQAYEDGQSKAMHAIQNKAAEIGVRLENASEPYSWEQINKAHMQVFSNPTIIAKTGSTLGWPSSITWNEINSKLSAAGWNPRHLLMLMSALKKV